jgi:hypothetical protein
MKKTILLLSIGVGCLVLAGLAGDGRAAAGPAKPSCAACHADFQSVVPKSHPPVTGKEIAACLMCHKPGSPDKAAPNPFAARIHRAHTGTKLQVDCLLCHTWTAGKGFGLAGQKESWGAPSKEEMDLLKKTFASWSESSWLDALHAQRNVICAGCHAKRLPARDDFVENGRCLECHGSYEKLAEKSASAQFPMRNPHRSHLVGLDCTKCHASHGESRSYCLECHPAFEMKIPGGAVGMSKGAK